MIDAMQIVVIKAVELIRHCIESGVCLVTREAIQEFVCSTAAGGEGKL